MLGQVGSTWGQVEAKLGQVDLSWRQVGPSWAQVGAKLAQDGPKMKQVGPKMSKKIKNRIGSGMFVLWSSRGLTARADPLSRSFDLRKIDIDQLSLALAADHKGAAQD